MVENEKFFFFRLPQPQRVFGLRVGKSADYQTQLYNASQQTLAEYQGSVFGLARAESIGVNFDRKRPKLGPVLDGDSSEHRASPPTRAVRIEPVSVSYLEIPLRAGAGRCQWNPAFGASE